MSCVCKCVMSLCVRVFVARGCEGACLCLLVVLRFRAGVCHCVCACGCGWVWMFVCLFVFVFCLGESPCVRLPVKHPTHGLSKKPLPYLGSFCDPCSEKEIKNHFVCPKLNRTLLIEQPSQVAKSRRGHYGGLVTLSAALAPFLSS